jgi:hypothetical protein
MSPHAFEYNPYAHNGRAASRGDLSPDAGYVTEAIPEHTTGKYAGGSYGL